MSSFIRNIVFIGVTVLGIAVLWAMLPTHGSLAQPTTFRPASDVQSNISEIAGRVDAAFESDWQKQDISPVGLASDLNVARRLSLGLNGTIPSVQEIKAFEAIDSDQRVHYWFRGCLRTDDPAITLPNALPGLSWVSIKAPFYFSAAADSSIGYRKSSPQTDPTTNWSGN